MNRIVRLTRGAAHHAIVEQYRHVVNWFVTKLELNAVSIYERRDTTDLDPSKRDVVGYLDSIGWVIPPEFPHIDLRHCVYVDIREVPGVFRICNMAYDSNRWNDFIVVDVWDDCLAVEFKLAYQWEK